MLTHYWRIALRHLLRHKGYAFINVAGLAVGLTCCLLIALFVRHEQRFDRFHTNADHIYRVGVNGVESGSRVAAATTPAPLGPMLEAQMPGVLAAVRVFTEGFFVERGEARFHEDRVAFADSSLFSVFDFKLLRGDPATALRDPFSVVITEAIARKYFGDADPMGETLRFDGIADATITGILAPIPATSHLQFDFLGGISTKQLMEGWLFDNWQSDQNYTYILVPEEHNAAAMGREINQLVRARATPQLFMDDPGYSLSLEPLTRIYLHSDRARQVGPTGSAQMLSLLVLVGGFILLIACINFTNLATARAVDRAKEVGVRKVVGAGRGQLAAQFLGEAVLLCALAVVLSVAMAQMLLPTFADFTGKALVPPGGLWGYVLALMGLTLVLGVIAGGYPALVLSGFQPVAVLKGRLRAQQRGGGLRKGLVILQFAISIALIAATTIVFTQLRHLQGVDPGYQRAHMLVIDYSGDEAIGRQIEMVKARLRARPDVEAATASYTTPAGERIADGNSWNIEVEVADGTLLRTSTPHLPIDYDFLDTYGIEVVAGRGLSEAFPSDANAAMLINEAAVKHFGFVRPEDAIGQRFETWPQGGTIVGVIRDFNYRSLHEAIGPLTLRILPQNFTTLTLRLDTDDIRGTVAAIETAWQGFGPERPFLYRFLDETFDAQYRADTRFGQIFGLFAGLAILIACLGLFGLAAFTAERRTKEIGIRKVLGASSGRIVLLLTKDFAALVGIGFLVGAPVAYLGMASWLDGFAYRMTPSPALFAAAGLAALALAWLTVAYQSLRAANANPVESLRSE